MVTEGRNPRNLITLAGSDYVLARDERTRRLLWTVRREPSRPEDAEPFVETLAFGNFGMGASLVSVRDQHDYSLGCDVSEWSELGPGPEQLKVGLALDAQITALGVAQAATQSSAASLVAAGADDSSAGTVAWTNPGNVVSSNNVSAIASSGAAFTTHWLLATNPTITVPAGATVAGIAVAVEGNESSDGTLSCQIIKGGVRQTGTTLTSTALGVADSTVTFGGVGQVFGLEWTPSDVTGTGFGAALSWTTANAGGGTISLDAVTITVYYRTAAGAAFLYAGGGAVLKKVAMSDLTTVAETKTFAHTSAPSITDLIVLKQGAAPGSAWLLIGFGQSAPVQQIDLVTTTTDTYGVVHATPAYGGVFAQAIAETNTAPQVWKSTGAYGQQGGPFCRVQSAQITASGTLDLTAAATWAPSTPYQVGGYHTAITGLTEYQRGLYAGKPEGVFGFDDSYNAYAVYNARPFPHDDTGKNLTAWGQNLVIAASPDLAMLPARPAAAAGLTTLVSNLSPVSGRPTAVAAYGDDLFVAYYDGTDSYIVRQRQRTQEPGVPHDHLFYPVTKVASHKVQKMVTGVNASNVAYLFYDCPSATSSKYDVGYYVLGPAASRRYATGGTWYSTRGGDARARTTIEAVTVYGVGVSASHYWTLALDWDDAATFGTSLGTVTATGAQRKTLTAGTGDSGYLYQFRATSTLAANTARPRLRGLSTERAGGGGLIVEGQRQPVGLVDRLEFTVAVAGEGNAQDDGQGGVFDADADEAYTTLTGLLDDGPVNLVYFDHFGDESNHKVVVQGVKYTHLPTSDGSLLSARAITVTCRLLQSS